MINFRYHIVSLVAVFLALAIGVIMGSAVIDRAIVDRLEDQQRGLEAGIDDVEARNDTLVTENRDLKTTAEHLAEEGSQRLLAGTLTAVPVIVICTRGVESDGFDDLVALLDASGADRRGTIWLTDRFALDDDGEQRDLAAALGADPTLSPQSLRTLALTRFSTMLRRAAGPTVIDDPSVSSTTSSTTATQPVRPEVEDNVLVALRDAGFVDYEPPHGEPEETLPRLVPGTRVVLVSGAAADVSLDDVAVPFAGLLVADQPGVPQVALLAAEDLRSGGDEPSFTVPLREDDETAGRLSTVDNIGDFAGRLAAVLAIADIGEGRIGHYGRGPGAQRLLPAPPE